MGTAAYIALRENITPRDVHAYIHELQQTLLRDDCYIPGIKNEDENDLVRKAEICATHALENSEASYLKSGVSRTVGEISHCWAANVSDAPAIEIKLQKVAQPRKIHIKSDSNLSREITISINSGVIARQCQSTPPEILRACRVRLMLGDACVHEMQAENLYQRFNVLSLPGVKCDRVVIDRLKTHGADIVKLFEIRMYE